MEVSEVKIDSAAVRNEKDGLLKGLVGWIWE